MSDANETLYEHAGGDEGLHRLEEIFYGKALADPVLKHVFTKRVPTHVDHLTWFTAESFGGPDRFSRELGFQYLIDIHRHLNITDEQRDRFVSVYLESLDEASRRARGREPHHPAPDRIAALASLGVPAVALPGMHGDPFFTALSTPGVRQLAARMRSPNVATTRRSAARGVIGPRAAERAPDGFFEVVHEGMRQPGFRTAMLSHMSLAMRRGRPRPENFLSEDELRQLTVPVLMIWGDEDPYGDPEIGRRTCALIPNARLEVIPGRHAPFLDDPERCGAFIDDLLRRGT
jgi:truncated hemoglobin YjbI